MDQQLQKTKFSHSFRSIVQAKRKAFFEAMTQQGRPKLRRVGPGCK